MNIFGLRGAEDGFPICELLAKGFENREHRNHIEIARDWFDETHYSYSGIMFIFHDGSSTIYTP